MASLTQWAHGPKGHRLDSRLRTCSLFASSMPCLGWGWSRRQPVNVFHIDVSLFLCPVFPFPIPSTLSKNILTSWVRIEGGKKKKNWR